jgi:segregation and condensation protein B
METKQLKNVIEAALLASGEPLSLDALVGLFGKDDEMPKDDVRGVIKELQEEYEERGIRLIEVASGYRIQVADAMSPWLQKLWEGRPPRFSRALMETLAITAYRQPLTRGDIEEIRGVAVSTNIIRNLLDRGWLRPVGQRDVPGRPTLYATTKSFLDYFGLKRLEDLPPLADLQELDPVNVQLELSVPAEERVLADGISPGTRLVGPAGVNELPEEPASVTLLADRRKSKAAAAGLEIEEAVAEPAEGEEPAPLDVGERFAEATEEPLTLDVSAAEEMVIVEADETADEASAAVVPQKQS